MSWQPIETAPKDGTPVLIFDPSEGGTRTVAQWFEASELSDGWGWTDLTVSDWGMQYYREYFPTHWMPLPDPPENPSDD